MVELRHRGGRTLGRACYGSFKFRCTADSGLVALIWVVAIAKTMDNLGKPRAIVPEYHDWHRYH